jgi:hypothetical protein
MAESKAQSKESLLVALLGIVVFGEMATSRY